MLYLQKIESKYIQLLKTETFFPHLFSVYLNQTHLCNAQIHKEFEDLSAYTVRDLLFLFQFRITKKKVTIYQQRSLSNSRSCKHGNRYQILNVK